MRGIKDRREESHSLGKQFRPVTMDFSRFSRREWEDESSLAAAISARTGEVRSNADVAAFRSARKISESSDSRDPRTPGRAVSLKFNLGNTVEIVRKPFRKGSCCCLPKGLFLVRRRIVRDFVSLMRERLQKGSSRQYNKRAEIILHRFVTPSIVFTPTY